MENPCLTFVTPTLLTGDRSATNVVAHEIAHSWTGNLVTNATWEHFWLNEGWTVRILNASLLVLAPARILACRMCLSSMLPDAVAHRDKQQHSTAATDRMYASR